MSESTSPQDASPKRARARKSAAKKPRVARSQAAPTLAESLPAAGDPQVQVAELRIHSIHLTAIDRLSMIATAAYFRAERRRFAPGHELEDWVAAEADIEVLVSARPGTAPRERGQS